MNHCQNLCWDDWGVTGREEGTVWVEEVVGGLVEVVLVEKEEDFLFSICVNIENSVSIGVIFVVLSYFYIVLPLSLIHLSFTVQAAFSLLSLLLI